MKRFMVFVLVVLISGAALAGLRMYLYCIMPHRPDRPALARVVIPEGASVRKTAAILERQGVISDEDLFVLLAKIKKAEQSIKAGPYSILLPAAPLAVLDKLVRGEVALRSVTIPEGSTIFDIARIFERAGLGTAREVLSRLTDEAFSRSIGCEEKTLEGFLFPDTYRCAESTPLEQMLRHMFVRFQELFRRELEANPPAGNLSLRERLVLASLVEKEARDPS